MENFMDCFEKFWEENYAKYELPEKEEKADPGYSIWDDPDRLDASYAEWEASWIDGSQY